MQPSRQQISAPVAQAQRQDHAVTRGLMNAVLIGALFWSLLGALGWLVH